MRWGHRAWMIALWTLAAGCADSGAGPSGGAAGIAPGAEDPELGKSLFEPAAAPDAKEDSLQGRRGPPVTADDSDTAVWEVWNDWEDTDTPDARKAGIAWPADSGLTWDEKYALWIRSMKKIDSTSYFQTYELTTPYGKTLPAPALECAETSIFLRATFASWYHLPFFLEASDRHGNRIYLGHFGFRTADGRYADTPRFAVAYSDYSDRAATWRTEGWPTDEKLRRRRLGGSQDDFQDFLFEGARAGAYFDEIFLNKRVGYFMIYALSYFGSVNLADPRNTFNLAPEAVREGDTLLERWQRRGIGHTLVVKNVTRHAPDALEVELISGSMPRRQGKWESASASKSYFVHPATGGPRTNGDGEVYAKLGGGLKRWRVARAIDGRWTNVVPEADREVFIDAGDTEAIAARLATFERILREVTPEEKREVLLQKIEDARAHLRRYPASCAARTRREEAFEALYDLESEAFERTRSMVDRDYRRLEDYVLAELEYEKSKTCCWNSSTAAMYEIIMLKAARDLQDAEAAGECREPPVFMNQDGGYEAFAAFAAEIGRADEWVEWSEDEPCPQRDVLDDTPVEAGWTPWCEVGEEVLARDDTPDE